MKYKLLRATQRALTLAGAVALPLMAASAAAQTAFENKLSESEIVDGLLSGGYVIFIRHAKATPDYADQVNAVMGDCSTQRPLSEEGWQEARAIGQAMAALDIPVGDVVSSQYCRAWQTADLAFGRYEKTADLNFEPAEDYSDEQWQAMKERVTPHLAAVPADGVNTVLVGHDDPFEAATGVYPEPMGIAFMIKPDGSGGFELLASVEPAAWADLK
ncbi:MAG: histidine phosphatase family protein [Pseudomonadota bacterium]